MVKNHKETKARFLIAHHLGEMIRAKVLLAESLDQIYPLLEAAGTEFRLFSMKIEFDQGRYPHGNNTSHGWTNREMDEGENKGNGGGPVREEVLLSPDHGLKVCVRYNHVDESGDLSTEHLLQMSRIVEASSARAKEIYPMPSYAEHPMVMKTRTSIKKAVEHAMVMGRGMPGRVKNGRTPKGPQL